MPRPRLSRIIENAPVAERFKPQGIPAYRLEEVVLPLEGLEALRLADRLGLMHEEAAERMNVSRQTFGRVLAEARRIVADALVTGKIIRIEGGDYSFSGEGPPRGQGRRRRRGGL